MWNLYTKLIGGGIVIILLLFFPIGKLVISCFSGLIFGQALQNDQMWMLTFVIMIVLSLFTILSLKHKLNFYLLTILGIVLYLIAVTQGNINTVALFGFLFVITVLLISNNFVKKHGSKGWIWVLRFAWCSCCGYSGDMHCIDCYPIFEFTGKCPRIVRV